MNQTSFPVSAPNEWRTRFLQSVMVMTCIVGLAAIIPAIISSKLIYSIIYVVMYALVVLITVLPVSYNLRAGTLVTMFILLAISGITETGIVGDGRFFMIAAISMASILFNWRAGWIVTALAMVIYIVFGWLIFTDQLVTTSTYVLKNPFSSWVTYMFTVLLIAALMVNSIRLIQTEFTKLEQRSQSFFAELRGERETLEVRIQERTQSLDKRTNQLRAVADVGKSITSYRNLSELLQQTAQLIHENFGYYHVGIFLLDERKQYAVLAATNSEGGRQMLERGHQLKVGETGIVGYVAQNIQPRIALDVGEDAVYFNNPDLPKTRSEMALPLVITGQILGVLDVQSIESQAFSEDDVSTLQILAEQIAVAIQNANLFDETEKALEASRQAYGEVTREAWIKLLRSQSRIGYIATQPNITPTLSDTLEPTLTKAIDTGDLIIADDNLTISVPIKIRGQVIGAIRLKKSDISDAWTQDETTLAVTLSDQLSSALESARLYRDSQQRAARESLVSDISARLSAASQTELILRETVQELGEALGNASVTFQLVGESHGTKPTGRENGSGKGEE